ncbi:hypothetical protein PGTUg99_026992 [Puccinia graminis f. sp. tritici]|uniref:RNase H type-1 domain-containing protein n=1 Tax=Puccinia graminis f. sp. tritici TaxID=56615 RepID=A0A5B0SC94_PUCGR|nr:hypothetical protein PGTUg99_026992 [Puccinia graminis f. sp. tritici]
MKALRLNLNNLGSMVACSDQVQIYGIDGEERSLPNHRKRLTQHATPHRERILTNDLARLEKKTETHIFEPLDKCTEDPIEFGRIRQKPGLITDVGSPSTHPIKRLIDSEISNSPSTHPSPIHNILDKHLLNTYDLSTIETIHPHIISPWEDFSLPISNLKTKKEDIKSIVQSQIEQSKSKSEHLIFTDGSNIPENGTGSAAILDNSIQSSFCINSSDKASAFEAEVQAIINHHLSSLSDSISTPPINFFVDNQATLYSISHPPLPISYQSNFINIFNKFKIIINSC